MQLPFTAWPPGCLPPPGQFIPESKPRSRSETATLPCGAFCGPLAVRLQGWTELYIRRCPGSRLTSPEERSSLRIHPRPQGGPRNRSPQQGLFLRKARGLADSPSPPLRERTRPHPFPCFFCKMPTSMLLSVLSCGPGPGEPGDSSGEERFLMTLVSSAQHRNQLFCGPRVWGGPCAWPLREGSGDSSSLGNGVRFPGFGEAQVP